MHACLMPSRPGDRFAAPLLEAENPWGGGGGGERQKDGSNSSCDWREAASVQEKRRGETLRAFFA